MKKGSVFSAILGGAFFAIPYLALDIAFLPSTVIAIAAYGAGNLILNDGGEKDTTEIIVEDRPEQSLLQVITEAKKQNAQIYAMMNKVEDKELVESIQ